MIMDLFRHLKLKHLVEYRGSQKRRAEQLLCVLKTTSCSVADQLYSVEPRPRAFGSNSENEGVLVAGVSDAYLFNI